MELQVLVKAVVKDKKENFIVLLSNEEETKILPIWIGPFEAQSIACAFNKEYPARPLTHDLIKYLCDRMDSRVEKVIIKDINEKGTYFAELFLQADDGDTRIIDSRPSDAIALALRFDAPVYISFKLIEFTVDSENLHIQYPEDDSQE